jgi:hypothetical protein
MLSNVGVRAMRSIHDPKQHLRRVALLALWMSLAVSVPAASAQIAPNLWSIQLDGGVFQPIEASGAGRMAGMRYCKHYNSHLQGGLLTGWGFKRAKLEAPAAGPQGLESSVAVAEADAQLVPVMGFLQVDLTDRIRLVPFAGIGAGYEWLLLHNVDHRTGLETKANYGNVAWESYAGLGLRLTSRVRLNSEIYYNGGSLERKVLDDSGKTSREAIHVNGVGIRVGLDTIFE